MQKTQPDRRGTVQILTWASFLNEETKVAEKDRLRPKVQQSMKNVGCGAFLGLHNSMNKMSCEASSIGQRVKRVFSQNSFGEVASDSDSLVSLTDKESE